MNIYSHIDPVANSCYNANVVVESVKKCEVMYTDKTFDVIWHILQSVMCTKNKFFNSPGCCELILYIQ